MASRQTKQGLARAGRLRQSHAPVRSIRYQAHAALAIMVLTPTTASSARVVVPQSAGGVTPATDTLEGQR
jgi:hypothetical protein